MSTASSEIVWLRRHYYNSCSATCNNTSAIKIDTNQVQHENTKHIEVAWHYIRELVIDCLITLQHIYSQDQLVNLFIMAMIRS